MSNILAPADAERVSFSPPVVDNESTDLYRDRQALAGVIEEGRIAGAVEAPLPDEEYRPDPSDADARMRHFPLRRPPCPQKEDGASTRVVTDHTPEAA